MLPIKTLFAPTARLAAVLLILLLGLASTPARAVLPIEHWTSPSGARVYFVRAPAIPMIDIAVVFDAGSRLDPSGKSGLASLAVELLDAGVPGMDEEAIASALADIGAQRSASASDDRAVVTLRSLTSEAELSAALRVTERTLSEPAFPAAVLTRERERIIQALREAQTKPETLASRPSRAAYTAAIPMAGTPPKRLSPHCSRPT